MLRNLFLMVTEITCLRKQNLKSWSRNVKWMLLTLAFANFNDKHSHRLELDSANCRYEESRREQARLHEELAQREKHFEILVSEISMKWKNWRKLRKCEFTNSLNSNWEKVMLQYRSSHHRSKSCKRGGICEWLKRISTYRIDLQWKIISRSQSADSRSKSSIYVEPRPKPAIWYMEFVWDTGKRFWQSTSSFRIITDTLSMTSSLY